LKEKEILMKDKIQNFDEFKLIKSEIENSLINKRKKEDN
jgi:hypothetical protein